MKMPMKTLTSSFAVLMLAALPALAQENSHRPDPGSRGAGGGGTAVPRGNAGGAGGGTATSGGGGGTTSSGGGGGTNVASGGSGGRVEAGGRHGATGGSGVAISRPPERRDGSYTGTRRGENSGGATGIAVETAKPAGNTEGAGGSGGGRAVGRDGSTRDRSPDGGPSGVPPHARPRHGDEPTVGTAVARTPGATSGSGVPIIVRGGSSFYPWWIFGGTGYYGGYYGGYYDPWYGAYPMDPYYYDPQPGYSRFDDEGTLRLKIKPREAEVYVDGYYVGIVDDFDGIFQRLHIESGPHRIEVRAPGYEPLTFDVRISPDHGTTYQGELKRIQ